MAFMPFSFLALPALRVFMLCSNGASKVLLLASELAAYISLAAGCRANTGSGARSSGTSRGFSPCQCSSSTSGSGWRPRAQR